MTLFDRSYKQPHRSVSHSPLKSYYVFVKAQNKLLNQQDISDLISFVFEKILSFPFPFFRFLSQISMNVLIFFAHSLRDSVTAVSSFSRLWAEKLTRGCPLSEIWTELFEIESFQGKCFTFLSEINHFVVGIVNTYSNLMLTCRVKWLKQCQNVPVSSTLQWVPRNGKT